MTRHDVANLVIRTFALWLGVTGIMTLASVPWLASLPDQPAPIFTALILTIPLPAGVALWKMAPRLAGTWLAAQRVRADEEELNAGPGSCGRSVGSACVRRPWAP